MRAKRSKKYRKIMSAYNLHFSFRTPYQVLCDSNFLRTCHAFHMPIRTFLDNTLHGESRPYLTKCTLEEVTRAHQKKFAKMKTGDGQKGRGDGKPLWLPLPEEVPLRYCKHKDAEGNERGIVSEVECLFDLVSGQVKGNEVPKNKQHYILATAESEEEQLAQKSKNASDTRSLKRKRGPDIREQARMVPGVPIVYVKRSVMILEELSGSSEKMIRGTEKEKFREGLVGAAKLLKRKRGDDSDEDDEEEDAGHGDGGPRVRGATRARGPNPLSVKKKKPKNVNNTSQQSGAQPQDTEPAKKQQRRKRGKKHSAADGDGNEGTDKPREVAARESAVNSEG